MACWHHICLWGVCLYSSYEGYFFIINLTISITFDISDHVQKKLKKLHLHKLKIHCHKFLLNQALQMFLPHWYDTKASWISVGTIKTKLETHGFYQQLEKSKLRVQSCLWCWLSFACWACRPTPWPQGSWSATHKAWSPISYSTSRWPSGCSWPLPCHLRLLSTGRRTTKCICPQILGEEWWATESPQCPQCIQNPQREWNLWKRPHSFSLWGQLLYPAVSSSALVQSAVQL